MRAEEGNDDDYRLISKISINKAREGNNTSCIADHSFFVSILGLGSILDVRVL